MTIFGFTVPLWILLSLGFLVLYFLFSVLDSIRIKKAKKRRENFKGEDIQS